MSGQVSDRLGRRSLAKRSALRFGRALDGVRCARVPLGLERTGSGLLVVAKHQCRERIDQLGHYLSLLDPVRPSETRTRDSKIGAPVPRTLLAIHRVVRVHHEL